MSAITKEQLIEELKASTQNSSGMFEIGEETICALMSMLTNAAPQLSQPAVAAPLAIHDEDFEKALSVLNDTLDDCGDSERGLLLALDKAGIEVRSDACRAAMIQSGNFRENKNSSTNYPVIPSEVLSAILKVAKIRADFDDFDGDRRGIGDCLDDAEQELIVTINKYASQLAAEPIATNDVREQTAVPPVPVIQADVAQAIEKLKRKLVECNRYNYCADAVKGVEYACHAAMLQGADDSIAHEGKNRPEDKLGMVDHFGDSNNMVEPATDNTNQQFESLSRGDK